MCQHEGKYAELSTAFSSSCTCRSATHWDIPLAQIGDIYIKAPIGQREHDYVSGLIVCNTPVVGDVPGGGAPGSLLSVHSYLLLTASC